MFPWEFCEISKNIFSTEHLETIASGYSEKRGQQNKGHVDFDAEYLKLNHLSHTCIGGLKKNFMHTYLLFYCFFFLHEKRIAFKCSIDLYLSSPDYWIILIYWATTHNREKRLLLKPGPWKTSTLKNLNPKNLDPEEPGPWKTWTLKNTGIGWVWKND